MELKYYIVPDNVILAVYTLYVNIIFHAWEDISYVMQIIYLHITDSNYRVIRSCVYKRLCMEATYPMTPISCYVKWGPRLKTN